MNYVRCFCLDKLHVQNSLGQNLEFKLSILTLRSSMLEHMEAAPVLSPPQLLVLPWPWSEPQGTRMAIPTYGPSSGNALHAPWPPLMPGGVFPCGSCAPYPMGVGRSEV